MLCEVNLYNDMFENLTEKITTVINRLGNKGRLSESDIDEALKEIRLALLDADVNFKVARTFVQSVKEKLLAEDVLSTLTAGQHVVRVTNDELISILGGVKVDLITSPKRPSVALMVGLNGSGKTTTSAKLGKYLSNQGKVTLVAADVHRPAAIDQLVTLGEQISCEVHQEGKDKAPEIIAKNGVSLARKNEASWAIVDTAGRFQVDDELMSELERIKDVIEPDEVLLVVDAMTGQEAVTVAEEFHARIGLTGLVLTKMDGDARGGAALSITSVTGVPVKFIGTGERVDGFEQFHPDRLASRILGMGDVLSLVEKAQSNFDEEQAQDLERKIRESTFDLEDFLQQMQAVKKMGPMSQVLEMIPGFSSMKNKIGEDNLDGSHLSKAEAIIYSMTLSERQRPEQIGGSRRRRIARGSGTSPQDVNQLLNQFKQIKKLMKDMSSPRGQKRLMSMMSQQKGGPFGF